MVYSRATTSAMAERPAGFLVVLGAVFGVGILSCEKGSVSELFLMPMPMPVLMTGQGEGEGDGEGIPSYWPAAGSVQRMERKIGGLTV